MPGVPCLEYHGHSAATQLGLDRVTIGYSAGELAPLGGERQGKQLNTLQTIVQEPNGPTP